jgi:hypothetical protein
VSQPGASGALALVDELLRTVEGLHDKLDQALDLVNEERRGDVRAAAAAVQDAAIRTIALNHDLERAQRALGGTPADAAV